MILFAASERVFGQLPWKKDDVRELFLLFAFFILIFILFFVFSIVWILAGDASHFRPLSSNSLPNRGIHMTLQFFPYANSGSTRPVGTASNLFFFLSFYHLLPFFAFLLVCGMSQPSHTCRIPGNDREASDLVDQSTPWCVFFPAMIYHANIFRIREASI